MTESVPAAEPYLTVRCRGGLGFLETAALAVGVVEAVNGVPNTLQGVYNLIY